MASPQPVLKGGYLQKQGSLWRSWKRRYFSLTSSSLNYYAQAGDAAPKGSWSLSGCTVSDSPPMGAREHILVLTNLVAGSSLRMQAERAEDKAAWLAALQHNIHLLDAPASSRRVAATSAAPPSVAPPASSPQQPSAASSQSASPAGRAGGLSDDSAAVPLLGSSSEAQHSTRPPVAASHGQQGSTRTHTAGGSTVPPPPTAPSRSPSARPTRRSTALGRISVFCTTWNMGEGSLDPALMPAWLPCGRDVYGIALQEALAPERVADAVQAHLGRSYITISHAIGNANTQLGYHGFISVLVCVHERLIAAGVALPSVAQRREVRLGRNLVVTRAGNKGAVAVVLPLRLPDSMGMLTRLSSFTFVACHLASDSKGASKLASRNGDAAAMLAGLQIGFPTGAMLPSEQRASGGNASGNAAGSGNGPLRDQRSVSLGPLHTAAADAADAALETPPSSDDEGGVANAVGFTSGAPADEDKLHNLPSSEDGSISTGRGDSGSERDRGRSSTLFFPLGRGDSVIRGRQSTTGSAAQGGVRGSHTRQHLTSVHTRGSAVSSVRFFTGDAAPAGGVKRGGSPEPFPSESPLHGEESDSEDGGGFKYMGGASTGDPVSRGPTSTGGATIPQDGDEWSPSDMAAAILNGYVFMCGDLNYRVKMSPEQAVLLIAKGETRRLKGGSDPPPQTLARNVKMLRDARDAITQRKGVRARDIAPPDWLDPERPWRRIILMEELRAEMTWGNLWLGWEEAAICFPPTYRRVRDPAAVLRRMRGDYADLQRVAHGFATHLAKGGGILQGRAALPFLTGAAGQGGVTLSPTGAATLDGPIRAGSKSKKGSRSAVRPALANGTKGGRSRTSSVATRDLVMQMPKGARGGKAAAWLGASERRASKGVRGGLSRTGSAGDLAGDDSDSGDSVTSVASAAAPPSSSLLGGARRPGIQFAEGTRDRDGSDAVPPAVRKAPPSGELSRVPSVRTRAFVSMGGEGDDDDTLDGELTHLDVPLQPHLLSPPSKPTEGGGKKSSKKFRLSMAPSAAPSTGASGPKTRRRSVMPTALAGGGAGGLPVMSEGRPSAAPLRQASEGLLPSRQVGVGAEGGGSTPASPAAPPATAPDKKGTFKRLRQSIVGGVGMSQSTRTLRVGTASSDISDGSAGALDEGVKITTRTPSYTDRILVRRPLSQQPPVVRAQVLPDWVMPGGVGPRSSMYGALTSLWQPGAGADAAQGFVQEGGAPPAAPTPLASRSGTVVSMSAASGGGVHVRSERAPSDGSAGSAPRNTFFESARASGTALPTASDEEQETMPGAPAGSLKMGASDIRVPLPAKPPVLPPLLWSRYDMADEVLGSDHVPVVAEFELDMNSSVRGTPELGTRLGGLLAQGGTVASELLEASSALQRITAKEAARSLLPTLGGAPLHPMQDATAVLAAQLHSLREKIPPPPPRVPKKTPPSPPYRGDTAGRSPIDDATGVDDAFSDSDGDSDEERNAGVVPPLQGGVDTPLGSKAPQATRDAMRMSFQARSMGGMRSGVSSSSMESGSVGGGSDTVASSLTSSSALKAPSSPLHTPTAQAALSRALAQHLCDPARLALDHEIKATHQALKSAPPPGSAKAGQHAPPNGAEVSAPSQRPLVNLSHVPEPSVDELFEAILPAQVEILPPPSGTSPPKTARRVLSTGAPQR